MTKNLIIAILISSCSLASIAKEEVETTYSSVKENYFSLIRDEVEENWKPKKHPNGEFKVKVCFDIDKEGEVHDATVCQKTKHKSFDLTAKQAILDSSPLPRLPEKLFINKELVNMEFDFTDKTLFRKEHLAKKALRPEEQQKITDEYMDYISKTIFKYWDIKTSGDESFKKLQDHENQKHLQAMACFEIDRGGNLQKVEICKPSIRQKFDEFSKSAVYEASPFKAPPEFLFPGNVQVVPIHFLFDYYFNKSNEGDAVKM